MPEYIKLILSSADCRMECLTAIRLILAFLRDERETVPTAQGSTPGYGKEAPGDNVAGTAMIRKH